MATSSGIRIVFWLCLLILVRSANVMEDYMIENCFKTIKAKDSHGYLASQAEDFYGENIDCTITISASVRRRIRLSFKQLDIQGGSIGYCRGDYLRVYDGPSSYSQQIGVDICGGSSPGDITSSSNYVTVRFWSDSFGSGGGFWIQYETFKDDMDRTTGHPNQLDVRQLVAIISGVLAVLIITFLVIAGIKRWPPRKVANPHTRPAQPILPIPPPPYFLPYDPATTGVQSPIHPEDDAHLSPWSPIPSPLPPYDNEPPPAYAESTENQSEQLPTAYD